MQALLSAVVSYINSFRSELAILAFMIFMWMWMSGHRFGAICEGFCALVILGAASTLAPTWTGG